MGLIGNSVTLIELLVAISTVLAGLMAGLFFAYSVSVVLMLDRLSSPAYTRVMQSINEEILNPVFSIVFGGAVVIPLLGAILILLEGHWTALSGQLFLVGTLTYLVGTAGVTVLVSVPMNDDIETWLTDSPLDNWKNVRSRWKQWNHVRTGAAVVSFVLYVGATFAPADSFSALL